MELQGYSRKLSAILSADAVGYSRLMRDDETATVRLLEDYKLFIFDLVKRHRGRVVDSPGDNLLADFPSVVNAVQCAVETQKELDLRNAVLPENRRMQFRIGINLGDVIEEGSRIYGDGVNIAARLESLSDPGGICISKTAFDQVASKLSFIYEFIGNQTVKNIPIPVGAYRVIWDPNLPRSKRIGIKKIRNEKLITCTAAILILIAGIIFWQNFAFTPLAPPVEAADPKLMAFPLPDLPSIAVLPLSNLTEDPKQQLLCDGITDNIINSLSKLPQLFVIARSSTTPYKGSPPKKVSEALGIQYVLDGSFQRSGNRVRIAVQLINALSGHSILTDRFDGEATEIFEMQDDITLKVLNAIRVKLGVFERPPKTKYKGTQGLDCFLMHQEAFNNLSRGQLSMSEINEARAIVKEGLAKCPEMTAFYRDMALCNLIEYISNMLKSRQLIDDGIGFLTKALTYDDGDAEVYALLCHLHLMVRDYDKAVTAADHANSLDPGSAWVIYRHAVVLTFSGNPDKAIPLYEKSMRLNPYKAYNVYHDYATALRDVGRLEEAIVYFKKALEHNPKWFFSHVTLAVTYSLMGRDEEARSEAEEILKMNPAFTVEWLSVRGIMKDPVTNEKISNALRKIGIPEK